MTLEQTAVHEAGHAVVAYVLGLACKELALTHDQVAETGAYGYATGPNPVYGYSHGSERDRQTAMRDECVACCGGLAAEHVLFGVPLSTENENAQADFRNILQFERDGLRVPGKKWGGSVGDDDTWRYIDRSLLKARRLVLRHQDAIEQLAKRLVDRRRLDGDVVKQLLDKWV